mgnify:CR=1 FL=1
MSNKSTQHFTQWLGIEHKVPVMLENRSGKYITYGFANEYPYYLLDNYRRSSKHNAIVNGKVNYIMGGGWQAGENLTVEQQAAAHGAELWKRDPEKCCEIRKVDSLGKKLFELDLWIAGMRRDQSNERSSTPLLSLAARPDNSDVWKLNPLVDWSREQVWAYLKEHDLPHNVLHDRGLPLDWLLALHAAHLWRR